MNHLRQHLYQRIASLRRLINQSLLHRRLRPGILILGSPHSGTSLMAAMLDSHRHLASFPMETGLFFMGKKRIPATLKALERFAHSRGAKRWVEKTPDHLFHIPEIKSTLPDAPIIMMVRDDRDVVASLKARFLDFEKALDTWKAAADSTRKHLSDSAVHVVHYEALVSNPTEILTRLCAFIREPFDDRMLKFHRRRRLWYSKKVEKPADASAPNHPAHRNWQINQPIFDGRGRWTKDLSDEEKRKFTEVGEEMLRSLGYAEDD